MTRGLRELVVEDLGRLSDLEGDEDLPLALRGRRALDDAALCGLERDRLM